MSDECPTCGSVERIDNGEACAQCGGDLNELATPICSGSDTPQSAFHAAMEEAVKTADVLQEDARQARQTTAWHRHKLEQIEQHFRAVQEGRIPAKECIDFLLREYFPDLTQPNETMENPEMKTDTEARPLAVPLDRLVSELKGECCRYANGECQTLACLKRGGYKRGEKPDFNVAICERHEQVVALEALLANVELSCEGEKHEE